jgi:hypothetical protein
VTPVTIIEPTISARWTGNKSVSLELALWMAEGWEYAPYILADEKDLVALLDELSYTDGAQVA